MTDLQLFQLELMKLELLQGVCISWGPNHCLDLITYAQSWPNFRNSYLTNMYNTANLQVKVHTYINYQLHANLH